MKYLLSTFLLVFLSTIGTAQSRIHIIPQPTSVHETTGSFLLHPNTKVAYTPEFKEAALYLSEVLKIKALPGTTSSANNILLSKIVNNDSAAYTLTISPNQIKASASHTAGILNAVQSIAQVYLTGNQKELPCAVITDRPRFGYRGFMLDVSRNFASVDYVKKTIDLLSLYKMNRLHLHLTDGAGWRIQIDQYPELTRHAAWRSKRTWKEWWRGERLFSTENDPVAYGGYYTKAQAKDLVAYAAKRGITIIPEIEMPGHSDEVLEAYPHLKCAHVTKMTGEFCIGNDSTFTFMQDVLTEIMDIFPSTYIHIGGDEANKQNWKQCHKCQKRIKENNLKD